jgi:hypothetical protein
MGCSGYLTQVLIGFRSQAQVQPHGGVDRGHQRRWHMA